MSSKRGPVIKFVGDRVWLPTPPMRGITPMCVCVVVLRLRRVPLGKTNSQQPSREKEDGEKHAVKKS